jgi:hypothetical protein
MTVLESSITSSDHLRRERDMQYGAHRLQQVQAYQTELRTQRQAERLAVEGQAQRVERGTVRRQVGERLVRLGERVGGDASGSPAVTG